MVGDQNKTIDVALRIKTLFTDNIDLVIGVVFTGYLIRREKQEKEMTELFLLLTIRPLQQYK